MQGFCRNAGMVGEMPVSRLIRLQRVVAYPYVIHIVRHSSRNIHFSASRQKHNGTVGWYGDESVLRGFLQFSATGKFIFNVLVLHAYKRIARVISKRCHKVGNVLAFERFLGGGFSKEHVVYPQPDIVYLRVLFPVEGNEKQVPQIIGDDPLFVYKKRDVLPKDVSVLGESG